MKSGIDITIQLLIRPHAHSRIDVYHYKQGRAECGCVGGCVVVPGGVLGGISAGPRGLFSVVLAVAIVLMMVC